MLLENKGAGLRAALMAGVLLAPGLASAQSPRSATAVPPPPAPVSSVDRPQPAADMQEVLDAAGRLGAKPIALGTPAKVRQAPTPADAAMAVMARQGMSTAPDPAVATRDMPYGSDAKQFVRIYTPAAAASSSPLPVVVYYHGGGWVIANVKAYDASTRAMAKALNAVVVSVEYRRAPEHKVPAQHEDALAAYRWVLGDAHSFNGDVSRLAFAGESAGGNLAVATAVAARDAGLPLPRRILSVYPIAETAMDTPSYRENAQMKPFLSMQDMAWFTYYVTTGKEQGHDPRLNLVAADLHGLPPVTIVNADIDPLRDDGAQLQQALQRAGVTVDRRVFPGVTHEFFGMGKVVRGAYDAEQYAFDSLKADLGRRAFAPDGSGARRRASDTAVPHVRRPS